MATSENISYFDGDFELEGLLCRPEGGTGQNRPLVVVTHPWLGVDDFVRDLTGKIADLGYVAFALDVYGKGIRGKQHSDGPVLKKPFLENPDLLRHRLQLGYDQAMSLSDADTGKVAAIGHCFGGLCVLELAKLNTDMEAIISVHGVISEMSAPIEDKFRCKKAFVFNGAADPLIKAGALDELQADLTRSGVDWTVINYGLGGHAFTNPNADGHVPGIQYNAALDVRTWAMIEQALAESLGDAGEA